MVSTGTARLSCSARGWSLLTTTIRGLVLWGGSDCWLTLPGQLPQAGSWRLALPRVWNASITMALVSLLTLSGVLNLGAADMLGQFILCCGGCPMHRRTLGNVASLSMPSAPDQNIRTSTQLQTQGLEALGHRDHDLSRTQIDLYLSISFILAILHSRRES